MSARITVFVLATALATAPLAFGFQGMGKSQGGGGAMGAAAPAGTPAPSTTPETVAKVNGEKIAGSDFDRNWSAYLQQRGMPGSHGGKAGLGDDPQFASMKKEVLENLIGGELLWQEAKKLGFTIDSKEVDSRIAKVKTDIGGPEKFEEFLKANRVDESYYRNFITKQLSVGKLIEEKIIKGISASEKEIHEYYLANAERFTTPEQVRASHILCKVDKDATPEAKAAAKKKIEGILAEAKKGTDFAELAGKNSDCPSSTKGGDLGTFGRGRMVKPFEDAAFALKKAGDLSGVVETDFGYHIIKLTDRKDGGVTTEKEAADGIKQTVTQQKSRKAIDDHVKGLRDKAKVDILLTM
jgi:peptidyl-prolyl cis-trans isomerase C